MGVAPRFSVTLETERLQLVPLTTERHAEDVRDLYRDREVTGSFGGDIYEGDRLDRVVTEYTDTHQQGPYRQYAIVEKATDRFVGFIGVRRGEDGAAELAYIISPASWGKGYATEATGPVLIQALAVDDLPVVVGAASNEASARVMVKAGMAPTGVTSVHGPVYAMERAIVGLGTVADAAGRTEPQRGRPSRTDANGDGSPSRSRMQAEQRRLARP